MTPVIPNPPYDTGDMLIALCVWREARGCNYEAKLGVVWTLYNRAAQSPFQGWPDTPEANVLKPWQYSSFNPDDPNSSKYPGPGDQSWADSYNAAVSNQPDPTGGAQFYFSRPITEPPKAWGPVKITVVIDGLTFCRLDPAESVT